MNRFSSLFFFRAALLCAAFFSLLQNAAAQDPAARRDSALARQKIELAQAQMDLEAPRAALAYAQEAERILRQYVGENDPRLSDARCLQGLALLRTDFAAGFLLWQQMKARPMPAEPLGQARAYFFLGSGYIYDGKPDIAISFYQKALVLYLAQPGKPHPNIGRLYTNLGLIAHRIERKPQEGADFSREAIQFFKAHYGPDFLPLAHPYNNQALIFEENGRYKDAMQSHQTSLALRRRAKEQSSTDIGGSFNNIGLVLYGKGNLEPAQNHFLQALSHFRQAEYPNKSAIAKATSNLGMVCEREFAPAEARDYFQQALAIERTLKDTLEIATSLYNIGTTYRDEGGGDTALAYFQQALQLAAPKHPRRAEMLNGIGTAHEALRDYPKAEEYYRQTDREARAVGFDTLYHPLFVNFLVNMANVRKGQSRWPEALSYNRHAQRKLGYEGSGKMGDVLLPFQLGDVLSQESQLLYRSAPAKDTAAIRRALASAERALFTYEQFSRSHDAPSERQAAKAAAFAAAEIAIAANCRLFDLSHDTAHWRAAFSHSERSKSILLLEAMRGANALAASGVDTALQRQARELGEAITEADIFLRKKLEAGANPTDSFIVQRRLERAALEERHDSLWTLIVKRYPAVGAARFGLRTKSVQAVQDSVLQPGQTLLEYFVGDSSVFVFLVKKGTLSVHEVRKGKDFPLEQWVRDMVPDGILGNLASPPPKRLHISPTAARNNYARAAYQIHQKLWAPLSGQLTQRVIVVPDGALSYVPFEALLTHSPDSDVLLADFPFLLHKRIISYCYSATLLDTMQRKRHDRRATIPLIGMASFFLGDTAALFASLDTLAEEASDIRRDTLREIEHSGKEVAEVAKLWRGKDYYGTDASARRFRREAADGRILLLSTHAKADDRAGEYSYLAFTVPGKKGSFEKLYARDLYRFRLNADLVVLSACETGIGQYRRGEGMVGMTQAFVSAGAKSLVTTLWSVNDQRTKDVMVPFFQYLHKGMDKDEALWRAKRDYLKTARGIDAQPYYWAGLIGIGEMRPLK